MFYKWAQSQKLSVIIFLSLCHHHHRYTAIYHANFDKTNVCFHASVTGTFCQMSFTKTGRRCGSVWQSIILSAWITAFWLVIEGEIEASVLWVITNYPLTSLSRSFSNWMSICDLISLSVRINYGSFWSSCNNVGIESQSECLTRQKLIWIEW